MTGSPGRLPVIPDQMPFAWGGPAGSGRIRVEPEDFQVVEIPLVAPDESGEHCWLYVRKRNSNTQWVARQLAQHAGVPLGQVSYAGLKDRNAVTEQWFSVHLPGAEGPDWSGMGGEEFQVLEAHRHSRKLQRGTLSGNRFRLRICEVEAEPEQVLRRLQQIRDGGFPNAFGAQRFGHGGSNLAEAERLFGAVKKRLSRDKRGIYLSAVRSALFNMVLAARIADGSWNRALQGEALQKDAKSACFVAEDLDEATLERVERLEVHPTGPLCGTGSVLATGAAADYEQSLLEPFAAWLDGLQRFRLKAARRSLRVRPAGFDWAQQGNDSWVLEFFLPSGAYATSLLREVFDVGRES